MMGHLLLRPGVQQAHLEGADCARRRTTPPFPCARLVPDGKIAALRQNRCHTQTRHRTFIERAIVQQSAVTCCSSQVFCFHL